MIYIIWTLLMMISSVKLSPTPRCSCVPPSSCSTQLYGRLPQDIALLGLLAPCPTHGAVMCCDRKGLEHLYQDSIQPAVISQVTGSVLVTGPGQVTGSVQVTDPTQVSVSSAQEDVLGSSPCSCVPSSSCSTQVYGALPDDIAVLGLYPPCPTHGEVLCCHRQDQVQSVSQESDRELVEQSDGQEIDSSEDEASSAELGIKADIAHSKTVRCGCIPRGICFQQFVQVTEDMGQCRGQVGLELCCVPGEHQDGVDRGVGDSDEIEVEDSAVTVKLAEETLEVADDNEKEKLNSLDQQLKVGVESSEEDIDLNNLTSTVTIAPAPEASQDRYSLPCVAVSLCKQEYSLTARDIARYGVMPVCVQPLVRCVQEALGEQSGEAVGLTKENGHLFADNKSVSSIVVELNSARQNLETNGNRKSPLFSLLKSRKVEVKKENDVKLPRNKICHTTTSSPKSSAQRSSTPGSGVKRKFFQRISSTQRPSILKSSSQSQGISRTSTPSNVQRINIQRSNPPTTRPVLVLTTAPSKTTSRPVLSTTTHTPASAEQQPDSVTRLTPHSLTLVPCTQSCPGTAYSPLSPLHRQLYGELAQCSPGLVRCVLHLDMQIFQHKDNFNLPIFNVKNFFSFFSETYSGKASKDQDSDVEQNNARNADDLSKEASVQTSQVSEATVKQVQVDNSSNTAGESNGVTEIIEDKLPNTARFFFENPNSSRTENGTNVKNVADISSISASRPQTLPPSSYPGLGSIVSRLRGKQILGNRNNQIQSRKPVRLLDKLLRGKLISKKTVSTSTTPLPSIAQELVSRGSHLPDVGEITGVEIVMPSHQMAKVMLHMDTDMMEVRLKDEQLLPVLQALINALEEI